MNIQKIISTLHPLERTVLPILKTEKELSFITKKSSLQEVEVMRALQWLENKEIIKIIKKPKTIAHLDTNGQKYLQQGLPEKRLLLALNDQFRDAQAIFNQANIKEDEKNICIGHLKKKNAILISKKENKLLFKIGPNSKKLQEKPSLEEKFLKKSFPLDLSELKPEEKYALDQLKKRKGILKIKKIIQKQAELTELGKKILKQGLEKITVINRLTSAMLKQRTWKNKTFRAYDIEINVPTISPGKKHFVTQAIEYAKKIWLEMGFKEMTGPLVQTSFWNFDALFTAQDHPARDLHDTFFIKEPAYGKLPNKEIVKRVKEMHEKGGKIGSKGWQYKWDPQEAKKNVVRTHTTCLSAQTLAKIKEDLKNNIPSKYFSVGKCFRNETLDWKHLFEFYQVEGIVVDPNANFKHLKGYLTEFYKKMGYEKVRMRPGYFPYVEPGLEVDVYHPIRKQWIELGGAGIFRPEVTKPLLGFECPILAWGQGLGRIISEYWKIKDIRDFYKNDLRQLRRFKLFTK